MERKMFWGALTITYALGAYLRLVDLDGPSLWLDEILHLHITQSLAEKPWWQQLSRAMDGSGSTENGTLYYQLQLLGQSLAPGDLGVRLLPAFLGLLTLPLMTWAALKLGRGRVLAVGATFLLAVSPLHIYFSREGRPYYLLMGAALWLLCALLHRGGRTGIVLAYSGCLLTVFIGLHGLPVLMAFSGAAGLAWMSGWRRREKPWRAPYLHYVLAGGLALAWSYGLYLNQSGVNTPVLDPSLQQTQFEKSPVVQNPLSASTVRTFVASLTTSGHKTIPMTGRSGIFLLLALVGLVWGLARCRVETWMVISMWLLTALLAVLALASVGRWYDPRYTAAALPAFLLLVALGADGIGHGLAAALRTWMRRRAVLGRDAGAWVTALASTGILVGCALPNAFGALEAPRTKADWRGVAAFVDGIALDGETVLVPNDWPRVCLDYYLQQRGKQLQFVRVWESRDLARKEMAKRPHGWLLTAGFRRDNKVRNWMHRFVPVHRQPQEDIGLFFYPDMTTLLQTRYEAGLTEPFEGRFQAMGQRFDFGGGEGMLQSPTWSRPEIQEKNGQSFQWALGPRVSLGLPVAQRRDAVLRFRATPFRFPEAPPQRLQIRLNEYLLADGEMPMRWSVQEIPIPAEAWSPGANILTLGFSRSQRPKDVQPGSPDERPLSAAFDYLEILPAP